MLLCCVSRYPECMSKKYVIVVTAVLALGLMGADNTAIPPEKTVPTQANTTIDETESSTHRHSISYSYIASWKFVRVPFAHPMPTQTPRNAGRAKPKLLI